MSKKPTRTPHHPARDAPPPEDDVVEVEEDVMPDEPENEDYHNPKHPDPAGKMKSHAPGYTTGPDGGSLELPKEEKKDE